MLACLYDSHLLWDAIIMAYLQLLPNTTSVYVGYTRIQSRDIQGYRAGIYNILYAYKADHDGWAGINSRQSMMRKLALTIHMGHMHVLD